MMNDMHQQLRDLYFNTSLNFLDSVNNGTTSDSNRWLQTLEDLEKIMIEFGFKSKQIGNLRTSAWEFFRDHKD